MKKGNVILVIVCALLLIGGLVSMPYIYKWLSKQNLKNPSINIKNEEQKKDAVIKIDLQSEVLKELVYPVMHNDMNVMDNYYENESISVKTFSNNDILYNAFLQIYNGYLTNNGGVIGFESNYLESRIQNIFGPKTGYNLTDFNVPNGANSNYIGNFIYNQLNKTYTYQKLPINQNGIRYYEIKKIYNVSNNDNNIINTYFYVAFVKLENNHYTLYRNFNYSDEISSGTFTTDDDLSNMLDKLNTKKYQYTFRKDTCNYDSYCFYEGKWLHE